MGLCGLVRSNTEILPDGRSRAAASRAASSTAGRMPLSMSDSEGHGTANGTMPTRKSPRSPSKPVKYGACGCLSGTVPRKEQTSTVHGIAGVRA